MSDNASDQILGIVKWISRTREIHAEIVFQALESAIVEAATKQYGSRCQVVAKINHTNGEVSVCVDGDYIPPDDLFETDELIEAAMRQAAAVLGQAERDSLLGKYQALSGQVVFAEVSRHGDLVLGSGRASCILPRDEQMPGDRPQAGSSVACVVIGASASRERVSVSLSRSRHQLVSGLLSHFVPEVTDGSVAIHSISRDAGYRSKVALVSRSGLSCIDACLGESGERISAVCDQLGGEKVDLIDWQASMEANVAAALKPAAVDGVYLFPLPGKAIAMLQPEEVSRAQGRNGRNLILASKLCGWDISLITPDKWVKLHDEGREEFALAEVPSPNAFLAEGIFNCTELSVVEPADVMRICGCNAEEAAAIISRAEELADF